MDAQRRARRWDAHSPASTCHRRRERGDLKQTTLGWPSLNDPNHGGHGVSGHGVWPGWRERISPGGPGALSRGPPCCAGFLGFYIDGGGFTVPPRVLMLRWLLTPCPVTPVTV